jgi:hypothetical protein
MNKNSFLFLFLLLIIIINLCLVIFYYNKINLFNKIIEVWIDKTQGSVHFDKNGRYEGDCYLSIYNYKNDDSHIHLIKNCEQSNLLCYIIKKNNKHSNIYIINKNSYDIVNDMIKNYNNFI